ncbi:MAG TPA: tRNA epoxyqueuosine(34) reductase QueG [Gemmatimonadales bacterium]|nr:tRNA epoxyqueuosine(34) reductase QueG [Gemmatimonadales bacterium]
MRTRVLKQLAEAAGFLACGVTSLDPLPHGDVLDSWLAKGYAGTMRYLHRQAKKRKDPALIKSGAKSVVVVLENYCPPARPAVRPSARIAKYAAGEDYHHAFLARLNQLGGVLLEHGATLAHSFADSGPVPERELAQRAGLGWIGKNTMLIRPGAGSFFFIGTIFTDLELEPDPPFMLDRCGSCTRCIDACPTGAFVTERVLDATKCLSFLTIEWKSAFPADQAAQADGWAFGCDICNDVCPWNERFATPTTRPEYAPREAPDCTDPDYFESMDEADFQLLFADTPLERPGLARMRRNWKIAFRASSS